MATDLECPVCEATIIIENEDKPGDLVTCSYCKGTFKIVKARDKLTLEEEVL